MSISEHRKIAVLLGYKHVEDWAADSDFHERDGEWFRDDPEDVDGLRADDPQDIYGAIEGAWEARGEGNYTLNDLVLTLWNLADEYGDTPVFLRTEDVPDDVGEGDFIAVDQHWN